MSKRQGKEDDAKHTTKRRCVEPEVYAGMSDGGQSAMISFSSMKQPPLIKQLKGILSEYPDGGQILKELIQNAEDANATKVKIEYDGRKINDDTSESSPYTKFFKGPALCVYNDAVFTEKDWDGIRMIYSSVKEDDRLTVGRFGLGFKSVFHITDYPCVLSGDKLLMIDPQQPPEKVNAMVKLSDVEHLQHMGLSAEAFQSALNGKFGLTQDCIKNGQFKGTIFRFPLRERESKLSETLYNKQKVFNLFDDFRSDSSTILLFLKNLESINLFVAEESGCSKTFASVEILDCSKIKKSRLKFKQCTKALTRDYKGEDIFNETTLTIRTTTKEATTDTEWIVVNYYVGNSASPQFQKLIQDENVGYSPYVSVATPMSRHAVDAFEGHVFCFLPLPKEGSKLTGLPVHVNGFFALSQSRHHLKQETDEQRDKTIDDKSILWNRHLIKEALPKAYHKLILNAIGYSKNLDNIANVVDMVYHCWPQKTKTLGRWQDLESELYKKLKTESVFFAQHKNSWITIAEACFATFSSLSEKLEHVTDAVKRCMNQVGLLHVDAPLYIFETVKHHYKKVKDVRPDVIAKHMHKNDAYKMMTYADKLDVLTYLLSDKNCYPKLSDLELLPLVSGRWTTFKNKHEAVYMCDEEIIKILPGLEHRLLPRREDLGKILAEKISQICGKDYCQLQRLSVKDLVKLIETAIQLHLGKINRPSITDKTKLSVHWLSSLWSYLIKNQTISEFGKVQIVPKLTVGTWEKPQCIQLVRLTDIILVKSTPKASIDCCIVRCFENMEVTVINALPSWIPVDSVKPFFFWPSVKGILHLLEHIYLKTKWQNTIDVFNIASDKADKESLIQLLAENTQLLTEEVKTLLRKLKLFYSVSYVDDQGRCSVLNESGCFILDTVEYPRKILLPNPCILANSKTAPLVAELGGRKMELQELVLTKLKSFLTMPYCEEIPKFMQYILSEFRRFQINDEIIQYASKVPFLRVGSKRHTPGELFDPSDSLLAQMLYGEDLIPETKQQLSKEYIRILQCLGLRNVDNVDADLIFKVAKSLDVWSKSGDSKPEYIQKAAAFLDFLKRRPSIVHDLCQIGEPLYKCIENLECIAVDKSNSQYPVCLTWYTHDHLLCKPSEVKEASLCLLVGATMPTVSCASMDLNSVFGWTDIPKLETVFHQLKTVKCCYSIQVRPDIMPCIKLLYDNLFKRISDIRHVLSLMDNDELIWTGEGFQNATVVLITKEIGDLDLKPYIYSLPVEFNDYFELFKAFGCRQNQNVVVLQDALHRIKSAHTSRQDEHIVKRDQRLVCNILDRIAYFIQNGEKIDADDILVMVHDRDKLALVMHTSQECVYDDDPDFFYEDTESMYLVHEMISPDTVEILGIKSITRKALMDAEGLGVELWEQKEHLTTRINSLLRDGYTDGLSVPKELIQNADDAGATTIKFLYDERQNSDARQRVFSRGMTSFQGPALWVFNDAQFSEQDLTNITKLNGATKQQDVQTIGKFGLGFCSVYNLTDIPSFLSGQSVVFFDPHEKHLGNILHSKQSGLKYKLPNRTLIARQTDQFKPYNGVFGCNILDETFDTYQGTLFRLPLRTEQQARESKICSKSYTDDEMKGLLQILIKNAGDMLLFSQNICSIELHHLSEYTDNPKDAKMIYKVEKECFRLLGGQLLPVGKQVLLRVPELLKNETHFLETHKSFLRQQFPVKESKLLSGLDNAPSNTETAWLTSWALGFESSFDRNIMLSSEGAVPLASVSVPCTSGMSTMPLNLSDNPIGFYTTGHIFCFLPLPIRTNLQVHINGCFSVTSDRRQLVSISEDDKSSLKYQWNESLLKDALVTAHIHLLENIATNNESEYYKYHQLWPFKCGNYIDAFTSAFYRRIITEKAMIFKSLEAWACFNDVCFLKSSIRNSDIGNIAFNLLSRFRPRQYEVLVDMPEPVITNIRAWNLNREEIICSKEIKMKELLSIFLQHIHDPFWDDHRNERIMLIIVALNCCETDVMEMMRNIDCIPTEPNQTLRKASDLIHPYSNLADLFIVEEEVFPLDIPELREKDCLQQLNRLGMCEEILPTRSLIERCKSVQMLSEKCSVCAIDRLRSIMKYLSQYNVRMSLNNDRETLLILSNLYLLPALSKPKHWKFSWKADVIETSDIYKPDVKQCKLHCNAKTSSLLLAKPRVLFRKNIGDILGTVRVILNEDMLPMNVSEAFCQLSVKDVHHVSAELIVDQILTLSDEYNEPHQFPELLRLHDIVMSKLDKLVLKRETQDLENQLERISEKAVILIGNELLEPKKVAFSVEEECKPFLYRLPDHDRLIRKHIYCSLGVKERFDIEDIIKAMDEIKKYDVPDISLVNHLLINLHKELSETGSKYEDISKYHERLVAPDTEGRLWPSYQLVIENEHFNTGISMKVLHPSIAPAVGESLGVKMKQLRCFEEISCGISFGQREKLVTRIQGLLKAYPCDSSIMKELLQNADDAGASEIHFIKDYRYLDCENLFRNTCNQMQGPSLCVFNNSFFTKSDIEGIHDLGKGNKSDDPSRTGQYGVGFNAVYHLTDTPSFVTVGPGVAKEGLLFIFDPLCEHVPKATRLEPGIMCPVTQVRENFPGQLLGFSLDTLIGEKPGTVFRFPLRDQESEISNNTVTIDEMNVIIEMFKVDMSDSMLFLKNIKRITVSNITSGSLVEEYSVLSKLSNDDSIRKKRFMEDIRTKSKENIESKDKLLCIDPVELIYPLKIYVNGLLSKCWVIVQRFGMASGGPDLENVKKSFRSGDLGLSPTGGVAIPISVHLINSVVTNEPTTMGNKGSQQLYVPLSGRAFCFLPLPVETRLPVHVNGHFALDHESRRDLWTDGFRKEWNSCLIENLIVPAWLSGLKMVGETINPIVVKSNTWKVVNEEMNAYHMLFPLLWKTSGYWKYAASTFYKYTVYNTIDVFPSVLKQTLDNVLGHFDVSWEIIGGQTDGGFNGIFNCISDLLTKNGYDPLLMHKECRNLETLLKSFGLKLLQAPNTILRSIEDSGINVPISTPGLVIAFMQTHSDYYSKACEIGPIDTIISDTKYTTVENLKMLLEFLLLDSQFCEKIVGLPIILTADGCVRIFCEEYPIFISKFSWLLPKSSEQFLHDSLLELLLPQQERLCDTGSLKRFTFDDFVELLPLSKSAEDFASGREISIEDDEDQASVYSLTLSWLCGFYEFLCTESGNVTGDKEHSFVVDSETLLHNMTSVCDWSLLPCKKSSGETVLLPISKMKYILYLPYMTSDDSIRNILLKLDIPRLNTGVLKRCSALITCLQQYVPSPDQPYCLMKCLLQYKDTVVANISTCKEGSDLLHYFGRSLSFLKNKSISDLDLAKDLRQLPLYTTLQGTLTILDNANEILVLPRSIPKDGIQEWANRCKVTLLQDCYNHETIREFLGLKKADVDYVYGEMVLPNIYALPEKHIGVHVEYIRDKIGEKTDLTPTQHKIIKHLTEIAFIEVEGVLRRADDLYDPNNKLFKMMFTNFHFPPLQYFTPEWLPFLRKLGLISELNDKLLLYFAREIERKISNPLKEDVRLKSIALLRHFTKAACKCSEATLRELKTIRFILPFKEKNENTKIHPQLNNAAQLICFKGTVSSKHSLLCWSSSNLIPEQVFNKLDKMTKSCLEVLENPAIDSVVLHCQNVCQSFKGVIKDTNKGLVESQMTSFYDFFSIHTSFDLSGIRDINFVHLPEENDLVLTSEIVIDLPKESEIKPYLSRAPTYYGKYFDLFEVLGSKRQLMFCHYAEILSKVQNKSAGRELNPPERKFVLDALRGLFRLDVKNDDTANDVRQLYLPDENMILQDSKQIVLSNNHSMEMRLRRRVEINFFAGQSFLNLLDRLNFEDVIQRWPDHLKPKLLTDVVAENICLDESNITAGDNTQAQTIERCLRSKHLMTAICRLLKHQIICSGLNEHFDASNYEENISRRLQNVKIVSLQSLCTILKYNGTIVTGSEANIPFHIDYGDSGVPRSFYFVNPSNTGHWTVILPGLYKLVKGCVMKPLRHESLLYMLLEIESPHKFSEILDSCGIKSYDSSSQREYFPEPGTYVERQFIPFLEQGIIPFEEYEYDHVAMELEDIPVEGDIDTLFIYVRIVREVSELKTRHSTGLGDLGKMYFVNTGNKYIAMEKVPIYRLYRFVRREGEAGAVVLVNTVAADTQPFDQHCARLKKELIQAWRLPETERKRIFRRMLLRWHPDKNLDTIDYCCKVFQYLKIIYSRLENGEIMVDNVEEEIFRGPSHSSQTTQNFYKDINRRATKQSQAYRGNYDEYITSTKTGRFSHLDSTLSHVKEGDVTEANRWLRQAKSDFNAAKAFLSSAADAQAYNWICTICHQACETALKAAHYFIDRSSVPGTTHRQLRYLAPNTELAQQAALMDNRFGEPARLTYPDTPSRPNIPSTLFDKADAEFALSTTKETLEMVDDLIS